MRAAIKIAVVSDLHIGSTVGLPPGPRFRMPDGNWFYASAEQTWLWDCWKKFWSEFWAVRAQRAIVLVNGEFCEGVHHASPQILGQAEVMESMAVEVMRGIATRADRLVVTRGSAAHSKPGGMSDEVVARELGAVVNAQGWRSSYNWLFSAGGVWVSATHHISGAGVPWTAGNNMRRSWVSSVMAAVGRRERIPDLFFRSHVHSPGSWEYGGSRLFVTPGWKLRDEYAFKIGAAPVPVGGLIVLVEAGAAQVRSVLFHPRGERVKHV